MCYRFVQVMVVFARSGELPVHNHGHVEGLDDEADPLLLGEAIELGEDIEHGHAGQSDADRAKTHPKRPGAKN